MDNFIVSARKYRPSTFVSVVGQHSITATLKNAIKNNHLAHAYLFCGPRGVGKTTCARIFAKTLNCFNLTDDFEACNECESCKSFNETRSYNIHELDAASNNSVEDIRNLIDQVRIPPQVGKYSIYIIDEVHMLSSAAFNAFLKTLEEPPAHAIFILATTEKHKIIPTILSRCQIFDFNRIKVEDTVSHLQYVAESEKIEADVDGLNIIAQKADGAMRDALSYFDQIVSFSGKTITYKDVIENLNVLDYDYYFKLIDAFLESDVAGAFMIFDNILDNGFDGHHFITGLSQHIRDLLVCTDSVTIQLLEVGANIKQNYKNQSGKCTLPFLYRALQICNDTDLQYKSSRNQRLHVELALLKLSNILSDIESRQQAAIQQKNQSAVKNVKSDSSTTVSKNPTTKTVKPQVENVQKTGTLSIKGLMNKGVNQKQQQITSEQQIESSTPKSTNDFTQEELQVKWKEFTVSVQNPRLQSMLQTYPPALKENYCVEFKLNNSVAQETFKTEIHSKILLYLRQQLQNDKVTIDTVVVQQAKARRPYTSSDKLKFLAEKNPDFSTLQKKFDLDFI